MKELLEKRAEIVQKMKDFLTGKTTMTDAEYDELRKKLERLDLAIAEDGKTIPDGDEAEARAKSGRKPTVPAVDTRENKEEEQRKAAAEELETRAKKLKNGEAVKFEARAVTTSSTPLKTEVSRTLNPAFEQVGTLDRLVDVTPIEGGESFEQPFVKSFSSGGITEEGADYTSAEPTFGYAPINKVKITAYAEVTEEVKKLPAANYLAEVEKAVRAAMRIKKIQQIINGTGSSNGQFVGIANAPTDIIAATETKTIATIDEDTFDEIVYSYGGDENVEDDAVFIMNKLTLRQFAAVKDEYGHSVYDIKLYGNTATINGIGVVLTSHVAAYGAVTAGNAYIYYGKLKGYKLVEFSGMEVAMSTDYKFKQGQIAFRASQFCGGSPAIFNGFLKVIKESA